MAAQLQIDQVGLPTGVPGVSRTDGFATGAVVTLTNTGPGTTTSFVLFWVPPGDTTAVLSLAPTIDPKVWTFTPTAGVYGTYLVELTEDAGEVTQVVERRILAVRTANRALVVPAFNEGGDADASLITSGPTQVELADNNADDYTDPDLSGVQYAAWWRSLAEFISSLDDSSLVLTVATPALVTKTAAAVGIADRAARADHKHDVSTAPPAFVTKAAAAEGSAISLSRSDHKHDVTTAAPPAFAAGDIAAEGSATSLARSDHTHSVASAAPANVTKSSAAEGVATSFSRSNHKHDVGTAGAGALAVGDAAAEGSATSLARSDHRHSVATAAPVDVTKDTAAAGVATSFSRGDHKHNISTAAPVAVAPFGSALSEGTSTALARADHVHTIPASTGSANGYFSQTSITNGTVWTTAADIPEGNRFQFILTGAGGGGGSGTAARSTGNFGEDGAGGGGGGARPPAYWFSRGFLISQLPLTFTVPTGGAGGTPIVKSNLGIVKGGPGGSPAATSIVGASGFIAFAGAGIGSNVTANSVASGGGCWGNAVDGNNGGQPNDSRSVGSDPMAYTFGGAQFNGRLTASGTQSITRHGGGGGANPGNSPPSPTGGISQFGGGGGGAGGSISALGSTFEQGTDGGGHDITLYRGTTPATSGGGGGLAVLNSAGNPGQNGDENVAGSGGGGGAGNAVSSGSITARAGGAGGFPGGGGGGGGTALSSSGTVTSGAGGKGGDAQILLTAYL